MKKLLSIILFALNFSMAQTPEIPDGLKYPTVDFCVITGINIGSTYDKKYEKYKPGTNFGGLIRVNLAKPIMAEIGLQYYDLRIKTIDRVDNIEIPYRIIDTKYYYFLVDSKNIEEYKYNSFQVPFQLSFKIIDKKDFYTRVTFAIFKSFGVKWNKKNTYAPTYKSRYDQIELDILNQVNSAPYKITTKEFVADKGNSSGYSYGIGFGYKRFELNLNWNRREDVVNLSNVFRFNSAGLNLYYFIERKNRL